MVAKYGKLEIDVNVSSEDLKNKLQHFIDNFGFEQTLFISYPETGKYGPNILNEEFAEANATGGKGRFEYSVKAVLPEGKSSLKIILSVRFAIINHFDSEYGFIRFFS
jgi:hypothetical protein